MDLRGLPARENGSKESPGADERPRQGEVRSRREESGRRLLPGRVNPSGEARRAPPVTGSSNQGPHDPSRGEPRAIPAGERSRGPGVAFARSSRARAVTRPAEARGHPIRAQALRSRQNHSATRRKLPPTWRRGRPTPVPPLSQSLRPPSSGETRTGRRDDHGPCEPGGADEANHPRGGRLGPRGYRGRSYGASPPCFRPLFGRLSRHSPRSRKPEPSPYPGRRNPLGAASISPPIRPVTPVPKILHIQLG